MTKTASMAGTGGATGAVAAPGGPLVLVGAESGLTLIPQPTQLTRLNYFDGKFLRADDLSREQEYLRALVALSNRAGGSGVVHGFDVAEAPGGTLSLSAGLAVDPQGRVLWLPYEATLSVAELVERSRQTAAGAAKDAAAGSPGFEACEQAAASAAPAGPVQPTELYVVTLSHAEALCGEEDVYGRLCEDACVTSTQRPYRLEGVVVRAVPLALPPAACTAPWLGAHHRRSLVASAYFAEERRTLGREMSGARLRAGPWCRGAAGETGQSVPVAVISVVGGALQFVDAWTARRERVEMPPPRYWQWQLAMRPMAVSLAQLLQFQCHLTAVLAGNPAPGGGDDPCATQYDLLRETRKLLEELARGFKDAAGSPGALYGRREKSRVEGMIEYGNVGGDLERPEFLTRITDLSYQVGSALTQLEQPSLTRLLIEGGIVELPSAGYLPVVPGPVDVNTQVRRLLGDGVDLRFCAVRPDVVPHAWEEARHMDRICLLHGLEDPDDRPRVDVLVPDGIPLKVETPAAGIGLEVRFSMEFLRLDTDEPEEFAGDRLTLRGAGRAEPLASGGGAFHFAGRGTLVEVEEDDDGGETVPAPTEGVPMHPGTNVPVNAGGATVVAAEMKEYPTYKAGAPVDESGALVSSGESVPLAAAGAEAVGTTKTARETYLAEKETAAAAPSPNDPKAAADAAGAPFETAAWASVRIDGDPFALSPGGSVPLRAEIALSLPDDEDGAEMAIEVRIVDAELTCDAGGDGAATLKGRARGMIMVRSADDDDAEYRTVPVDVTVKPMPGGGGALVADVRVEGVYRVRVTTSWSGDPVLAATDAEIDWIDGYLGELLREAKGDTAREAAARAAATRLEAQHPEYRHLPMARVDYRGSAEVASSGNAYHDSAVSALAKLETLLEQPGFRASGEAKLFPPPKKAAGPAPIRATRDWVLFHRRRVSSCDCVCVEPAPAAQRRYRLYHVQASADATVEEIRRRLNGADEIPGMEIVGVVPQFVSGGASLATPRRDVADAWREAEPGPAIVFGAVAAAGGGAADPAAVLDARLEAVASIADDVTPDAGAVYEVFPAMPPTLSAGGVDGVIVLVTRAAEVQTQCHRVYGVGESTMSRVVRLIQQGSGLAAEMENDFTALGSVSFQDGTGTPSGGMEAVVKAFADRYPQSGVGDAVTVFPGGTVPSWAAPQGDAITRALGGTLTRGAMSTTEAVDTGCPAFTLIKAGAAPPDTVCHALYRLRAGWTMPRLGQLHEAGRVREMLAEIADPLGTFTFQEGTTTPVSDLSGLKAAWEALGPGSPEFGATFITDPGGALANSQWQQGMALNQAAGGPAHSNPWPTDAPISDACDVVTLLARQVVAPTTHLLYRVVDRYVSPDYAWLWMKSLIAQGQLEDALAVQGVTLLGAVDFVAGTTTPEAHAPDVAQLWIDAGGGTVTHAGTIEPDSLPAAARAVLRQQSMALADMVGGWAAIPDPVGTSEAIVGGTAITVLVTPPNDGMTPAATCQTVWLYEGALDEDGAEKLADEIAAGGLDAVLTRGETLGTVQFVGTTSTLKTTAAELAAMWPAPRPSRFFAVVPQGTGDAAAKQAGEKAGVVGGAIGAGSPADAMATVEATAGVPGDCPSLLLLVPRLQETTPTATTCHTVYRWIQAMSPDGVKQVMESADTGGGLAEVLANCQRLGDVAFQAGGDTLAGPAQAVADLWPSAPQCTYFSVIADRAPAGEDELVAKQAQRIATTMKAGGSAGWMGTVRNPSTLPTACGTITLLFPVPS